MDVSFTRSQILPKQEVLSEKDLGLIEEYANRYMLNGRKVEYPCSSQNNYYPLPLPIPFFTNSFNKENANSYSPQGKEDKNTNNKQVRINTQNGTQGKFMFAITILTSSIAYFIWAVSGIYGRGKEYYFTSKVKELSRKESQNKHEKHVIENLRKLLDADKSAQYLRNQNVKAFTAFGLITASGAYIASTMANFADRTHSFISDTLPSFMQPSTSLLEKGIEILSNDNLKTFSKIAVISSLGILVVNWTVNLYKGFFDNVNNPKMYLHQKATEIKAELNALRRNSAGPTYFNNPSFFLGSLLNT